MELPLFTLSSELGTTVKADLPIFDEPNENDEVEFDCPALFEKITDVWEVFTSVVEDGVFGSAGLGAVKMPPPLREKVVWVDVLEATAANEDALVFNGTFPPQVVILMIGCATGFVTVTGLVMRGAVAIVVFGLMKVAFEACTNAEPGCEVWPVFETGRKPTFGLLNRKLVS